MLTVIACRAQCVDKVLIGNVAAQFDKERITPEFTGQRTAFDAR